MTRYTNAEQFEEAFRTMIAEARRSEVMPIGDLIITIEEELALLKDFRNKGEAY